MFNEIKNNKIPLIALTLFLVAYWPTVAVLIAEWSSFNGLYSHGLLVVGISFYYLWTERQYLAHAKGKSALLSSIMILGFSGIWWAGLVTNTLIIQQLAVYCIFATVILTLAGKHQYKTFIFPLILLLFAFPVWGFLQPALRDLSVVVTRETLEVLGIPFFLQGNLFSLPGGSFLVELACSGLGFFLTAIVLGLYFCQIHQLDIRKRAVFLLFCMLLAVFSNWVRVILIMVIGNATNMQHFIATDHLTFGWILFMIMLVPLFIFGNKMAGASASDAHELEGAESKSTKAEIAARKTATSEATTHQEIFANHNNSTAGSKAIFGLNAIVMGIVIIIIPFLNKVAGLAFEPGDNVQVYSLPNIDNISSQDVDLPFSNWKPHFEGADVELAKEYTFEGRRYQVYVASYFTQKQDKELIYYANKLYNERLWQRRSKQSVSLANGTNQKMEIVGLTSNSRKKIIGHWYQVAGLTTTNRNIVKLFEVVGALTGNREAIVVAIATDFSDEPIEDVESKLINFADQFIVN